MSCSKYQAVGEGSKPAKARMGLVDLYHKMEPVPSAFFGMELWVIIASYFNSFEPFMCMRATSKNNKLFWNKFLEYVTYIQQNLICICFRKIIIVHTNRWICLFNFKTFQVHVCEKAYSLGGLRPPILPGETHFARP